MAYSLGNVKPHVKAVADALGPKFGIRTIYGYSLRNIAGTTTLSDHARGLALDFMCNTAQGDALSAYLVQNASALNVTYVIWNRKIWSAGRRAQGWRDYTGVSPHTDHVHASFADSGSSVIGAGIDLTPWDGILPSPDLTPWDGIAPDLSKVPVLGELSSALGSLADVARFVTDRNNWLRLLMFLVGCWLVTLGLVVLLRNMRVVQKATQATAKAVKTAKVVKNAR